MLNNTEKKIIINNKSHYIALFCSHICIYIGIYSNNGESITAVVCLQTTKHWLSGLYKEWLHLTDERARGIRVRVEDKQLLKCLDPVSVARLASQSSWGMDEVQLILSALLQSPWPCLCAKMQKEFPVIRRQLLKRMAGTWISCSSMMTFNKERHIYGFPGNSPLLSLDFTLDFLFGSPLSSCPLLWGKIPI